MFFSLGRGKGGEGRKVDFADISFSAGISANVRGLPLGFLGGLITGPVPVKYGLLRHLELEYSYLPLSPANGN